MNYQKYIASKIWRVKRQKRLEIDKFECRLCGEKGDIYKLEVHHKLDAYSRIPNESIEDDLTTLCTQCHNAITSSIAERLYSARVHVVETVKVTIERKIIDVEESRIQIDFISPVDHAQRPTGRPAQQVDQIDKEDYLKAEQDGRRP